MHESTDKLGKRTYAHARQRRIERKLSPLPQWSPHLSHLLVISYLPPLIFLKEVLPWF